jgi:hypothetical protein
MTDVAETVTSSKQTIVTPAVQKKYLTFEATVSTDNTVTLGDLADILGAALFKKSDGSVVSFTEATNVITITGASLINVPIVGFAYGT